MYIDYSYLREEMYSCEHGQQKLPYIHYARYIIKKYLKDPWKNQPNSAEFIFNESNIALAFVSRTEHKECDIGFEFTIRYLAEVFNINPFRLFNDKNLPFYFEPKAKI
jgi:hypothetical protein